MTPPLNIASFAAHHNLLSINDISKNENRETKNELIENFADYLRDSGVTNKKERIK